MKGKKIIMLMMFLFLGSLCLGSVHSVSKLEIIESLNSTDLSSARSVTIDGSYAYVASASANSLTVVDISNPSSITQVDTISSTDLDGAHSVTIDGSYAYVASYSANSLTVVDISYYISSTPTIEANIQDFYDTTNITINLTTNPTENTNMSYLLDNFSVTPTSICNNCNQSQLNLTNLSEGAHSILFTSENSDGQENSTYNFTIDTINPTITFNNNTEFNDGYTFNISQQLNVTCRDKNLANCTIYWDDNTTTFSTTGNFTEEKTFINNGYHTFTIEAIDYVDSHINKSGRIFMNPYQYFNFEPPTGTKIYNFTFGGEFFEETARFKIFDLVSENNLPTSKTLTFEKSGYESTNITISFNSTSEYNQTNTITLAKIVVHIYDRQTENLLTNNVELTLIDGTGDTATTSTGKYNFTKESFTEGEYHIIAESEGYSTGVIYFNFYNQEIVNVDIYMLNNTISNFGTIQLIAKDRFSRFVDGSLCQAKEWKSAQSSYSLVTEGLTNTNGEVLLDIELGTKEYIFTCTKEDYSATTQPEIIKTDLTTRTLVLSKQEDEEIEELSGLTYSISPNNKNYLDQIVGTFATVEFNYTDTNKEVVRGCIKYYKKEGLNKELLGENCSNSASANLVKTFNTNNSFTLVAEASVTTSSGKTFVLQDFVYPSNINIRDFLVKYGLDIILPTAIILLAIGLGLIAKNIYISLVLIDICVWLIYTILPEKMPGQAAMTITVLIGLIMWGVYRRK